MQGLWVGEEGRERRRRRRVLDLGYTS